MIHLESLRVLVHSQEFWTSAIALTSAWLIRLYIKHSQKLDLPIIRMKDGDTTAAFIEGMNKYPNEPFQLDTPMPYIVLPHSAIDEVKSAPEEVISFSEHNYDRFAGKWTDLARKGHHEIIDAIKIDLTRNISKVLSDLQDEVVYAMDQELGDCLSWTAAPVFRKVLHIVALLSGRTFVGLPLSRDPEWIHATITYTADFVGAGRDVLKWHPLLRYIVAPWIQSVRRLKAYAIFGGKMIRPYLDKILKQLRDRANGTAAEVESDDENIKDFNMLHWLLNHSDDINNVDPVKLGKWQMAISFAAIHTTSMALSHVIFDLAAHPEYIPELREEFETVIAEENFPDKRLRKSSLPKLKKLDSFFKESQRINRPGLVSMTRKVVARNGFTLSTGHTIPYGSYIGIGHPHAPGFKNPSNSIINNASQPSLDTFAPFRFSKLREIPKEESKHQFVSVGVDSIPFGIGRHTCPGRFFASNEIKVVIMELLSRYDLALGPNGETNGVGGYERPKNIRVNIALVPDPRGVVYFKNRVTA